MSELRYDPLSQTWVLVSEKRSQKPVVAESDHCPFCPGNEQYTVQEILRLPGDSQGWQVRVVPNKYNALAIEPQLARVVVGVYSKENGVGAHEVIIDHPHKDHRHPAELEPWEMELVFSAAKLRMLDLVRDKRMKYPVLFKNQGERAGASVVHPHWQLMVLPVVPRRIEMALSSCLNFFQEFHHCLICQIIADEMASPERVVFVDDSFIIWTPYAPQFPYELRVAPIFHHHRFEWTNGARLKDFSEIFTKTLRGLRSATKNADFNIVLYTAPWFENDERPSYGETIELDFHWYFQILPRTTALAGFEMGTGFYVNPISPENAAMHLREALMSKPL